MHLVPGKRILGRKPFTDDGSVKLLDSDPLGREHDALIRCPKIRECRSLLVQPRSQAARICVHQSALQGKEAAASDNRGLNPVVATPALQTAVRIENFRQQLVHGFPFQSSARLARPSAVTVPSSEPCESAPRL